MKKRASQRFGRRRTPRPDRKLGRHRLGAAVLCRLPGRDGRGILPPPQRVKQRQSRRYAPCRAHPN